MALTHSGRHIVPLSNAKEWVPWCGLLVNPATMQVRVRSISLSTHALASSGPGVQSHWCISEAVLLVQHCPRRPLVH